jgi:MFS family permease
MNAASRRVQRVYLLLLLFNTLAASFIWGVNTLFLLDAGLSNLEAFAANAFFTAGLVLFEIPTGVVADLKGRRVSYMLGTLALAITTLLYLYMWTVHAPFWAWAISSALLGLGFTFFSGAVEAWLVDALTFSGYKGKLETVFARGQVVQGVAMLTGSVAGGLLAQVTNLGVPYIVRTALLVINFILALALMKDLGFTPVSDKHPLREMKHILRQSIDHGFKKRPIRWIMIAGLFSSGVSIYAFYAMQPYLLQLYGDKQAYGIAGLAAALVAGAQIAGGLLARRFYTRNVSAEPDTDSGPVKATFVTTLSSFSIIPYIDRLFRKRTTVMLAGTVVSAAVLATIGLVQNFWLAVVVLFVWGLMYAAIMPVREAYLNKLITSKHRATVLSFDSLFSSSGGVIIQPILGKVADAWSYPQSYVVSSVIQAMAVPFIWLAHNEKSPADKTTTPS